MNDPAPQSKAIINIIKVLNSGIDFYQDGLKDLNDTNIKVLFTRMIEEKKEAVATLLPFARGTEGDAEIPHDTGVDIRNLYTHVVAGLSAKEEHKFINQLEEVEEEVLKRLDEALEIDQTCECAAELRRIRSRLQQCHDEMKLLQVETA